MKTRTEQPVTSQMATVTEETLIEDEEKTLSIEIPVQTPPQMKLCRKPGCGPKLVTEFYHWRAVCKECMKVDRKIQNKKYQEKLQALARAQRAELDAGHDTDDESKSEDEEKEGTDDDAPSERASDPEEENEDDDHLVVNRRGQPIGIARINPNVQQQANTTIDLLQQLVQTQQAQMTQLQEMVRLLQLQPPRS